MRERKLLGRVGQQGMRDIQRGSRGNPLKKKSEFDNTRKGLGAKTTDLSSVLGASDKEPTTRIGASRLSFLAEHDLRIRVV